MKPAVAGAFFLDRFPPTLDIAPDDGVLVRFNRPPVGAGPGRFDVIGVATA